MSKYEFKRLILNLSATGGFPAVNIQDKLCSYLTPEGRKCVVGVTIPDGHPGQNARMDSHDLYKTWPELANTIPEGLSPFDMRTLQKAHDDISTGLDNYPSPNRWNHELFAAKVEEVIPGSDEPSLSSIFEQTGCLPG